MKALWVDTDFGFDDLWALLLLKHHNVQIAGISLVAGNAPLERVKKNALGAFHAYDFDAPIWSGADRPLERDRETAERILGPRGMQSRGLHLPEIGQHDMQPGAVHALATWLQSVHSDTPREVLALGPLTNIANLVRSAPEAAQKISRLVWMGGSDGPGNHTAAAEFNALADPEAVLSVVNAGIPMDVVDLMVCRQVTFGADDLPETDPLTADLLGGYLDIGLSRGRSGMAIYDPTAAMAAIKPALFDFEPRRLEVSIISDETYGATRFLPANDTHIRLAIRPQASVAKTCLDALSKEQINVH